MLDQNIQDLLCVFPAWTLLLFPFGSVMFIINEFSAGVFDQLAARSLLCQPKVHENSSPFPNRPRLFRHFPPAPVPPAGSTALGRGVEETDLAGRVHEGSPAVEAHLVGIDPLHLQQVAHVVRQAEHDRPAEGLEPGPAPAGVHGVPRRRPVSRSLQRDRDRVAAGHAGQREDLRGAAREDGLEDAGGQPVGVGRDRVRQVHVGPVAAGVGVDEAGAQEEVEDLGPVCLQQGSILGAKKGSRAKKVRHNVLPSQGLASWSIRA